MLTIFLLALNIMALLKKPKECLIKKYNTKGLGKVKIIIKWQISWDMALDTMKIDQLAFIKDFVIKEDLTE